MPRTAPHLPLAVRRSLQQLGTDLKAARLRRRLPMEIVAERAQISKPTLMRAERGDAGVGIGVYATVLWVLGLSDRIGSLAAAETDSLGLDLEQERLPKRVRLPRKRTPKASPPDDQP